MSNPLSVLIAGSSADRAATIAQILQTGSALHLELVDHMPPFEAALSNSEWDLVICDAAFFDTHAVLVRPLQENIVFVLDDDNSDAVLSVLKAGGKVVLKSRIMDLADMARHLTESKSHHSSNRQARELLEKKEEELRISFDLASVGMAHVGLDGAWLKANPKLCEILGCGEIDLLGTAFHVAVHADDLAKMMEMQTKLLTGKTSSISAELRLRRRDGQSALVNLNLSILRDAENRPRHLIAIAEDIAIRRKAEEQLQFLSRHDLLTRLPNRHFLLDQLGQRLDLAESARQKIAVLFLDLDRFRLINDTLGHAAGDKLISLCGQYLAGCIGEADLAARLGSDEFVIVHSAESNEAVSSFSERLLRAISAPSCIEEIDVSVTACIGIAVYPDDGEDILTLLKKADTAMHRAKDAGGNHYRFYADGMAIRTIDHLMLENDLRHALARDEFVLHYQPQVDLDTGRMTTVEALIRWHHPKRGIIAPSDFIPLAEETGLIVAIGDWVLNAACRQAKTWQNMGMDDLRIAVNLSARQFHKRDLVMRVADALKGSGLAPEFLELEITESAIMMDREESVRTLHLLKNMGIRISIDDFGTGYSSLSYLQEFPIDKIKIDQSFIENIASNPGNAALTSGIIALAHSIKLSVTAEGVENPGQLKLLSACDSIQGFYFCHPMPAESLQKLIEAQNLNIEQRLIA